MSLIGIVLLTHRLGAAAYGLFLTAFVFTDTLREVGLFGQEACLIRMKQDAPLACFHQAFCFVLASGFVLVPVGFLLVGLLRRWTGMEGLEPIAYGLLLTLPFGNLGAVPIARMEHQLRFREVTISDITAIVANYGVAVPAAFLGAGIWSFVFGYWSERICYAAVVFYLSGYRPRWVWRRELLREQLGFGFRYSLAYWSSLLKNLANPLVVGRLLGAQAVGNVGLGIKIVDSLSFVRVIAARISLPALARVEHDRPRLSRIATEATTLQALCLALPLALTALFLQCGGGFWLVHILGEGWKAIPGLFGYLAAASLIGGLFVVQGAALHVVNRSLPVAYAEGGYFLLAVGLGFVLVPRFGLPGYGMALMAACGASFAIHLGFRHSIGRFHYGPAPLLIAAALPLLFVAQLGWAALAGPLLFCLWPGALRQTWELLAKLREAVRVQPVAEEAMP